MAKKPTYFIYVKYQRAPRFEFDRTQSLDWANLQRQRAQQENPSAVVTMERQ